MCLRSSKETSRIVDPPYLDCSPVRRKRRTKSEVDCAREGCSDTQSSPRIRRVLARQPEFLGSHLGYHSPIFAPNSQTPKSREPAYLGTSGLVSRVGLEPTTYGLKVWTSAVIHESAHPNCAKNCIDAHRRWPTQLTQKPSISDAGRRPPTPEIGSQSRRATELRHAP